jgi:hypothetical protein
VRILDLLLLCLLVVVVGRQPRLDGRRLARANLPELLLGRIVRRRGLVERVVRVPLKLLPDLHLALVHAQTVSGPVLLHLLEPPLLEPGVRGREAALRVLLDLVPAGVAVVVVEAKGVERVVDAAGVDRRQLLALLRVAVVSVAVELGEVQRALVGLLGSLLRLAGLAATGRLLLLLGEDSIALSLLGELIGALGSLLLSVWSG